MHIGKLDTFCQVLELHPVTLAPVVKTEGWFSVRQREVEYKDVAPTGLRNRASVIGRAWFNPELIPGRFLRDVVSERLFMIDAVRDPLNNQTEHSLAITELIGERAVYRSKNGGAPKTIRAFLEFDSPQIGETSRMEYRHKIEVAVIEAGRPQVGDEIDLRGVTWSVMQAQANADNAAVRDLWVKAK